MHKKLGHAIIKQMSKLTSKELVCGLPRLRYEKGEVCNACSLGKHVKSSFKSINSITNIVLQILHMDIFGPTRNTNLGGSKHCLVIVDDYSRFIWVIFLIIKMKHTKGQRPRECNVECK